MPEPTTLAFARVVRKQLLISAMINTLLSAAIFVAFAGLPNGLITTGAPDNLALDFLPQCGMVGLMSALVPPLVARREFAALTTATLKPVGRIVVTAGVLSVAALVLGAILAWAMLASPVEAVAAWQALIFKSAFGGAFGAAVTALAVRPPSTS